MRIYFDNCCYNRLFDEKTQERVKLESDAITDIMMRHNIIIGSNALKQEIDQIKDIGQKLSVMSLYIQVVNETININEEIINQAKRIMEQSSIKQMDALHLSCAINGNADIFLTVDDKLIRACSRLRLNIKVMNPLDF